MVAVSVAKGSSHPPRGLLDVSEVDRPAGLARRPDCNEHHVGGSCEGHIIAHAQTPRTKGSTQHSIEAGLVDGCAPLEDSGNSVPVDVYTDGLESPTREADRGTQPHRPKADARNAKSLLGHGVVPPIEFLPETLLPAVSLPSDGRCSCDCCRWRSASSSSARSFSRRSARPAASSNNERASRIPSRFCPFLRQRGARSRREAAQYHSRDFGSTKPRVPSTNASLARSASSATSVCRSAVRETVARNIPASTSRGPRPNCGQSITPGPSPVSRTWRA